MYNKMLNMKLPYNLFTKKSFVGLELLFISAVIKLRHISLQQSYQE